MTDKVSGAPNPTSQQVDPNRFGNTDLNITTDSHPINVDLAVQVAFLQYNQLMNLRTQDKLDDTQNTMNEMSKARQMYNQMKELKHKTNGGCTGMTKEMINFLKERDIRHAPDDDNLYSANEWDINMADLDSYIQKISGQNKTQMLELNQCVEDGNNALREVSTVFSKYSEIIQSIIQTVNR